MNEEQPLRPDEQEVTRILSELTDTQSAGRELLPLVYERLRGIAEQRMSHERGDHTLQATALVHEAYMRLLGDRHVSMEGRGAFYAAASEAMRRILIDHARRRQSLRRGGGQAAVPLDVLDIGTQTDPEQMLALDDALQKLEREDARAAEVVKLRFFSGLDVDKTADILGISHRTVIREWTFARTRLYQLLHPSQA